MTTTEINRALRTKWPSHQRRARRKSKLGQRFKGRLRAEAVRTAERLELLLELLAAEK